MARLLGRGRERGHPPATLLLTHEEVRGTTGIRVGPPLPERLHHDVFAIFPGQHRRIQLAAVDEVVLAAFLFDRRHLLIGTAIGKLRGGTGAKRFVGTQRFRTHNIRGRDGESLFGTGDNRVTRSRVARNDTVTVGFTRHETREIRTDRRSAGLGSRQGFARAAADIISGSRCGRGPAVCFELSLADIFEVRLGVVAEAAPPCRNRDRARRCQAGCVGSQFGLAGASQSADEFDLVDTATETTIDLHAVHPFNTGDARESIQRVHDCAGGSVEGDRFGRLALEAQGEDPAGGRAAERDCLQLSDRFGVGFNPADDTQRFAAQNERVNSERGRSRRTSRFQAQTAGGSGRFMAIFSE